MSLIPKLLTTHYDGLGLTELCEVYVVDDPHPVNGAHHVYDMVRVLTTEEREASPADARGTHPDGVRVGRVQFQRGPRSAPDSTPGTLDGALLSILIHRYECFQSGPFACTENAVVLGFLDGALGAIKTRAQERAARGVLGSNAR